MDHAAWLDNLLHGGSRRKAAEKIGLSGSTISRQLQRGGLTAETVIHLARAYNTNPIDALVDTGHLNDTDLDIGGQAITTALRQATNEQILEEINRRSDPKSRQLFNATNDHDTIGVRDDAPTLEDADLYQLPHIADSSDTEPEPGDDDYHDGP